MKGALRAAHGQRSLAFERVHCPLEQPGNRVVRIVQQSGVVPFLSHIELLGEMGVHEAVHCQRQGTMWVDVESIPSTLLRYPSVLLGVSGPALLYAQNMPLCEPGAWDRLAAGAIDQRLKKLSRVFEVSR